MSEEKQIRVEMGFKSYADYKAFNEKELFWAIPASKITKEKNMKRDKAYM